MSGSVNKVILVGNLGKDPELRYSQSGTPVCNFSIATTNKYKKGDEWVEDTEWHRIVAFGKTGENCAQYLAKGRQVYVEGRLQTNKWQDRDGNDRWTTQVVANNVVFLGDGRGQRQGSSQGRQETNRQPDPAPADDSYPEGGYGNDGVPF